MVTPRPRLPASPRVARGLAKRGRSSSLPPPRLSLSLNCERFKAVVGLDLSGSPQMKTFLSHYPPPPPLTAPIFFRQLPRRISRCGTFFPRFSLLHSLLLLLLLLLLIVRASSSSSSFVRQIVPPFLLGFCLFLRMRVAVRRCAIVFPGSPLWRNAPCNKFYRRPAFKPRARASAPPSPAPSPSSSLPRPPLGLSRCLTGIVVHAARGRIPEVMLESMTPFHVNSHGDTADGEKAQASNMPVKSARKSHFLLSGRRRQLSASRCTRGDPRTRDVCRVFCQ